MSFRELQVTAARIQRSHERALEAMPAFVGHADAIAARESIQDEADVEHARQHVLWEPEIDESERITDGLAVHANQPKHVEATSQ